MNVEDLPVRRPSSAARRAAWDAGSIAGFLCLLREFAPGLLQPAIIGFWTLERLFSALLALLVR